MLTVDGKSYKDVNTQDFDRYFGNTCMAWKLSPTKRRLYSVSEIDGPKIKGSYLTRESEFKDKEFPFSSWWESLDPIPLQVMLFNLPGGAAIWQHKLNKNLKKSLPMSFQGVTFHGHVAAQDRTSQRVCAAAFSDLYCRTVPLPSLAEALRGANTTVTKEQFLVDRVSGAFWYKSRPVGVVEGAKVALFKDSLRSLLLSYGISEKCITTGAPQKPDLIEATLPQKYGKSIQGYQPGAWPTWYAMQRIDSGEIRTYMGKYPGPLLILPGWVLNDMGGQQ